MPRPIWKNVNFFKNLEKILKTMGSKNGFFLLAYFRCIFVWNVFKWKNFWPISTASGWNWRFLKKIRQIFFRHFGGLNIGVGGWNFCCILVRCRPFDLTHFWVVAVEKTFFGPILADFDRPKNRPKIGRSEKNLVPFERAAKSLLLMWTPELLIFV